MLQRTSGQQQQEHSQPAYRWQSHHAHAAGGSSAGGSSGYVHPQANRLAATSFQMQVAQTVAKLGKRLGCIESEAVSAVLSRLVSAAVMLRLQVAGAHAGLRLAVSPQMTVVAQQRHVVLEHNELAVPAFEVANGWAWGAKGSHLERSCTYPRLLATTSPAVLFPGEGGNVVVKEEVVTMTACMV